MTTFKSLLILDDNDVRHQNSSKEDPLMLSLSPESKPSQCVILSLPEHFERVEVRVELEEQLFVSHLLILVTDEQTGKQKLSTVTIVKIKLGQKQFQMKVRF